MTPRRVALLAPLLALAAACSPDRVAPAGDVDLVAVAEPDGLLLTVEIDAGEVHILRREPLLRAVGLSHGEPEIGGEDTGRGRVLHAALYDEASGGRLSPRVDRAIRAAYDIRLGE